MHEIIKLFAEIISEMIHYYGEEPLNGDDTEKLGKLFALELDLRQGNITKEEYYEILAEIKHI